MANNLQLKEKIITARTLLSNMNVHGSSAKLIIKSAKKALELPSDALSDDQLLEKIVKAKIHLKDFGFDHSCMRDADLDYTGPCTCGATENNSALEEVKEALKI